MERLRFIPFPLQATTDDINNAFRRQSRIYHPDKHASDPEKAADAQRLFTKLKKAHEGNTHFRFKFYNKLLPAREKVRY